MDEATHKAIERLEAEGFVAPAPPTTSSTPSAGAAQLHTPPEIASEQDILAEFVCALGVCGVVGEDRNAQLVYLALTSRLLDEPVSLALKGVSSSGKSHTVETTLRFFHPAAYIEMTAMSERALVYMKDEFSHRTIVLFEAVALREQREKTESNLTAYFVRSLLSEGRISYPVTMRDKDGNFVTRTITKNGPTNLIVTTTATSLHGENETRLISLPTNDTSDQTRAILLQLAAGKPKGVDFARWHDLQRWLEVAEHRVTIPYARYLAENVPPVAVRLRRDFRSILRLIETHAILHQLSRERDETGRIIATERDYLAVRTLVADLISDGVGATVSPTTRETVKCISELAPANADGVTVAQVAESLVLDRSAAQRRLQTARERGFIANKEERRGRPARYEIDSPLPEERILLPHTCTPSEGKSAGHGGVCSSAATARGVESGGSSPYSEPVLVPEGKEVTRSDTHTCTPSEGGPDEATRTAEAIDLLKRELGAEIIEETCHG